MKKKLQKLKIKTDNKYYKLEDCALYKIKTQKQLAKILFKDLKILKSLKDDSHYNTFKLVSRDIECPDRHLDEVHTRIASLLSRIELPDYLHSGRKGHSHITNAKAHVGDHCVLTADIRKFYRSTSFDIVFKFFNRVLLCQPDVSLLLTQLCTYNLHIPTGSRISMPLAFLANKKMFDELNKIAGSNKLNFTVFVDDITFSGNNINKMLVHKVKKIVSGHGHKIHPDKTRLFKKDSIKTITGSSANKDGLIISNKHHRKIFDDMLAWSLSDKTIRLPSLENRLLGKLVAQSSIDYRYKDKARSLRNFLKNSSN